MLYHPNILRLKHHFCHEKSIYMITEHLTCDLEHFIEKNKDSISFVTRLYILLAIASGIRYMHAQRIIHRDIKPQNILLKVSNKEVTQVKIADFGISKIISMSLNSLNVGTIAYMAPEMYTSSYSCQVDIYGFGRVIQRLCAPKSKLDDNVPFQHDATFALYKMKSQCTQADPELRPSIDVIANQLQCLLVDAYINENKQTEIAKQTP